MIYIIPQPAAQLGSPSRSAMKYTNMHLRSCMIGAAISWLLMALALMMTSQYLENSSLAHHQSIALKVDDSFKITHRHTNAKANARNRKQQQQQSPDDNDKIRLRILHVVTSAVLFKKESDRFRGALMPTILGTAKTFANSPRYELDIQLILGYVLPPDMRREMEDALYEVDPSIDLFVWDDAMPHDTKINYETNETERVKTYSLALAKQHRYVVKAHLDSDGSSPIVYSNATGSVENGIRHNFEVLPRPYDVYSCWEDDMLLKSGHIDYHLRLTKRLENLAATAPSEGSFGNDTKKPLSRMQLLRMLPGLIRTEVIMDEDENHITSDNTTGKFDFTVDCCNVTSQNLMIWETNPNGFRVRPFPKESKVGTLGLLPVDGQNRLKRAGSIDVGDPKATNVAKMFAQPAGWMATKHQLQRFETFCANHGGFLPPFKEGFNQLKYNPPFWLGGFQLFGTGSGCSVQRVVPLGDADSWSQALIWHASNNKQQLLYQKDRAWDAEMLREEIVERYSGNKTEGASHLVQGGRFDVGPAHNPHVKKRKKKRVIKKKN